MPSPSKKTDNIAETVSMFRRAVILAVAFAACAASCAARSPNSAGALKNVETSAANAQPAVRPIPRSDRNSQIAHEQLLQKAKTGQVDVYFEGDSIRSEE